MNKIFRLVLSLLSLTLINITYAGETPLVFTQLTSSQSQPAAAPVNLASLENVDGITNIGNALTHVTIKTEGYYFIIAQGQAGAVKSSGVSGSQYVDIWLIKNGAPVPNSTSRITVSQLLTGTLSTQNILSLNTNDTISVGFTASDPGYGLIATPAQGQKPAITSLTFTIYKIS